MANVIIEEKMQRRAKLYQKIIWTVFSASLSIPLMWYVAVKYAHVDYTFKQILFNMLMGYAIFGIQFYGIRILIKLIKNYTKQQWFSEDNLKLYQRLGAVIFSYVFVRYFMQSISSLINADKIQNQEPIIFFNSDNLTLLLIGAALYLGFWSRRRFWGSHQS